MLYNHIFCRCSHCHAGENASCTLHAFIQSQATSHEQHTSLYLSLQVPTAAGRSFAYDRSGRRTGGCGCGTEEVFVELGNDKLGVGRGRNGYLNAFSLFLSTLNCARNRVMVARDAALDLGMVHNALRASIRSVDSLREEGGQRTV